ncbi:hypothetical protein I79_014052 [Cricetulus griseus]|uniref:Uncharacterized protein n=1 Tax=Cricetulus griseus TaxID=10029 RepID=G3HT40_CRIGR|nr:hypothetical protein I79_014052 [Cricetulus griseus]
MPVRESTEIPFRRERRMHFGDRLRTATRIKGTSAIRRECGLPRETEPEQEGMTPAH